MRDVSIIIPTYNRPADLCTVLPYYFCQDSVLEIIIVDDGSHLSYDEVISKYQTNVNVRLIYHKNESNKGAGASRNIGLSLAAGTYILWGEDDAFLSPDYVKILKKIVSQGNALAFGSIYYGIYPSMSDFEKDEIIKKQQNSKRPLFDYRLLEGYYRLLTDGVQEVPWGHALLMVKKDAYRNVSYFEGYAVNGYREETDAQIQISKAGYEALYTSQTCCYHFPAQNKKGGQHSSSRVRFEYYKIKNNNIFIDRHYAYLKSKFNLKSSQLSMKLAFINNEISSIFCRGVKKRLRLLGLGG